MNAVRKELFATSIRDGIYGPMNADDESVMLGIGVDVRFRIQRQKQIPQYHSELGFSDRH